MTAGNSRGRLQQADSAEAIPVHLNMPSLPLLLLMLFLLLLLSLMLAAAVVQAQPPPQAPLQPQDLRGACWHEWGGRGSEHVCAVQGRGAAAHQKAGLHGHPADGDPGRARTGDLVLIFLFWRLGVLAAYQQESEQQQGRAVAEAGLPYSASDWQRLVCVSCSDLVWCLPCTCAACLQEHAYYASFGYHVTNPFAISSRWALVQAVCCVQLSETFCSFHCHISSWLRVYPLVCVWHAGCNKHVMTYL